MSLFSRIFAICIAVTAAASLVPAAFAQTASEETRDVHGELQRTADFVNLMRSVFAPDTKKLPATEPNTMTAPRIMIIRAFDFVF